MLTKNVNQPLPTKCEPDDDAVQHFGVENNQNLFITWDVDGDQ